MKIFQIYDEKAGEAPGWIVRLVSRKMVKSFLLIWMGFCAIKIGCFNWKQANKIVLKSSLQRINILDKAASSFSILFRAELDKRDATAFFRKPLITFQIVSALVVTEWALDYVLSVEFSTLLHLEFFENAYEFHWIMLDDIAVTEKKCFTLNQAVIKL